MRKKSWLTLFSVSLFTLCFLLIGCGKGYEEEKDTRQDEIAVAQYYAILTPLNIKVGKYSGKLSINVQDNQFWARLLFQGPKIGNMNAQYIHFGGTCPSLKDDLNGDGFIDFMEAHRVAGDILIPLDSILETQLKGMNLFPKLKKKGSYLYSEATNYSRLMEDLRGNDIFPDDRMSKLEGEELNLETRVVLVYGVNEDRSLPDSVESFFGYPSQASLPIACGLILSGVDPNAFYPRLDDYSSD